MRTRARIFRSEAGPFEAGPDFPQDLFTPSGASFVGPNQDLLSMSWAMGSYTAPPNGFPYATSPAFEAACDGGDVFPGFGEGYGTEQLFPGTEDAGIFTERLDRDAHLISGTPAEAVMLTRDRDMENTVGSLGAEAWAEELAKSAGDTLLKYQQARIAAKNADTQMRLDASRPQQPVYYTGGNKIGMVPLVIGGVLLFMLMRKR